MSFEELLNAVQEGLDETQTKLLERESNVELLEKIVRDHMNNSLLANDEQDIIVDSIIIKLDKSALIGEVSTLIYVGGFDRDDAKLEIAKRQEAMFILLDADMAIDTKAEIENAGGEGFFKYTVWGKTPNNRVTDEWFPGGAYDIKIVKKDLETRDGTPYIAWNLNDYRYNSNQRDMSIATINNYKTGNTVISDFVSDDLFEEEIITVLKENILYQFGIFEFTIEDVRPVRRRVRKLEGDSYRWTDPSKESFEPIIFTNDNEDKSLVFGLTGRATIGTGDNKKDLLIYMTFYPQRFGQALIESPTLTELMELKAFQTESPENQADFLRIKLAGKNNKKKYRGIGSIRQMDASGDFRRLTVSLNGIGLIEQTEA